MNEYDWTAQEILGIIKFLNVSEESITLNLPTDAYTLRFKPGDPNYLWCFGGEEGEEWETHNATEADVRWEHVNLVEEIHRWSTVSNCGTPDSHIVQTFAQSSEHGFYWWQVLASGEVCFGGVNGYVLVSAVFEFPEGWQKSTTP